MSENQDIESPHNACQHRDYCRRLKSESSASPAGYVSLHDMNGMEIKPGIFLIGNPTPRPDLGPNSLVCLANVNGALCTVELSINLLET